MKLKPVLKYVGGKSRELSEIKKYLPEFSGKYIEPFLGGGALYFDLEPKSAIINDLNKPLMNFYTSIRDDYDKVVEELRNIQAICDNNTKEESKALYYEMRKMYNHEIESSYSDAALYYYINKMAFHGVIRCNKQGKFNVSFGGRVSFKICITEDHQKLLSQSEIYSTSYRDIFDITNKDDFLFLDPPYDNSYSAYNNVETFSGFTEDMHRQLAQDFKNLDAKALMVIGKTDLIEELYKNNIVHEYEKKYTVSNCSEKQSTTYIFVTNYKMR